MMNHYNLIMQKSTDNGAELFVARTAWLRFNPDNVMIVRVSFIMKEVLRRTDYAKN